MLPKSWAITVVGKLVLYRKHNYPKPLAFNAMRG
jgi:hypothetical protein